MPRCAFLLFIAAASLYAGRPVPFEQNGDWGYRVGRRVVIAPRFSVALPFNAHGIAAVADSTGWAYIDRDGKVLIRPFVFDNGADDFHDGLARFVENGKFGFFNQRGVVVIPAKFDFAEPFSHGRAAVCQGCRRVADGEHWKMEGGTWSRIDRSGRTR